MTTPKRPQRVYWWLGARREAGPRSQTREMVAAPSMAAAARAAGYKHPRQMFNLCETANEDDIRVAMSTPGVVFWKAIDSRGEWHRQDAEAG